MFISLNAFNFFYCITVMDNQVVSSLYINLGNFACPLPDIFSRRQKILMTSQVTCCSLCRIHFPDHLRTLRNSYLVADMVLLQIRDWGVARPKLPPLNRPVIGLALNHRFRLMALTTSSCYGKITTPRYFHSLRQWQKAISKFDSALKDPFQPRLFLFTCADCV